MRKCDFSKTVLIFGVNLVVGCAGYGPAEIHYGQDQCEYCKMTIADRKFGSELMNQKGKVYKFDSIECLAAYTYVNVGEKASVRSMWVTDFSNPGALMRVDSVTIILSGNKSSPMGVGLVAFSAGPQAGWFVEENYGHLLTWQETCELVAKVWNL